MPNTRKFTYTSFFTPSPLLLLGLTGLIGITVSLFLLFRTRARSTSISGREGMSFQRTSMFDQEYVDPDDGAPKKKRFVNESVKIWSQDTIDAFLKEQARINPDVLFDMDIVQQQTTEEDAQRFLKDGKWHWSDRTVEIYDDAITKSNMTKKSPFKGRVGDQTIYNENAILRILALNEQEGDFLLYGRRVTNKDVPEKYKGDGTYAIHSRLVNPNRYTDLIQCKKNKLQRKHFMGYGGIHGEPKFEVKDMDPADLPDTIKGFKFLKEPCNPCVGLAFPYDNSCPFSVKSGNVSPAWQKIWGLPPSPLEKLPRGFPYWIN